MRQFDICILLVPLVSKFRNLQGKLIWRDSHFALQEILLQIILRNKILKYFYFLNVTVCACKKYEI